MRLIGMLLALLIIGLLVYRQLAGSDVPPSPGVPVNTSVDLPKVPSAPKDVPQFEQQMNDFMTETAEQRAKKLEELERQ